MHLIIIAAILIIFVVVYFSSQANRYQNKTEGNPIQAPSVESLSNYKKFIFISKGKLFLWKNTGEIEEIHSRYIQDMIDRLNRKKELHGWKENTSLGTSFTGQQDHLAVDQVELQVVSAQFSSDSKLVYFLRDSSMGGLFEYDLTDKTELRLLHRQNLYYENLAVNKTSKKILCSQQFENGIANIVMLSKEGDDDRQLTDGDTIDLSPAWIYADDNKILYQSSGLARSESGYAIASGPSSVKLLDLDNSSVTPVLEDANFDFLQPRVNNKGDLYFIKRPYEMPKYATPNMLLDFVLFPFRLLRAIFHYLNFFSLMYSRKPLTTASGPQVNEDLKKLLIKGKRIDADKALSKESKVNGIPSLVPRSWQLIKRDHHGSETILATNVASFDITSDDEVIYSNGYAVFQLTLDMQSKVILHDKLIAEVISS